MAAMACPDVLEALRKFLRASRYRIAMGSRSVILRQAEDRSAALGRDRLGHLETGRRGLYDPRRRRLEAAAEERLTISKPDETSKGSFVRQAARGVTANRVVQRP